MITQAEFRIFLRETQQALQAIQTTLARLAIGNNLQRESEASRENYSHERDPIPRRQLAYENELSDDEEYVVHMRNMSSTCFDTIDRDNAYGRVRITNIPQGNRTMQAYVEEFHKLSLRNNLLETDVQQPGSSGAPAKTTGIVPPEAPRNPYAQPDSNKCYRCGQPGHQFNQCPRRSTVI
ncbi:hypothetical protein POTOM_058788 [Populus tomentosa]|uniref:CCHC-type domain-containing protein n=1 Tax=Populus tomentosa TaxID=118781 RepID=A0A8X8C2I9_POPTO|nr:hypothetical protein POTOM_058788 [Populus tomentosa]